MRLSCLYLECKKIGVERKIKGGGGGESGDGEGDERRKRGGGGEREKIGKVSG